MAGKRKAGLGDDFDVPVTSDVQDRAAAARAIAQQANASGGLAGFKDREPPKSPAEAPAPQPDESVEKRKPGRPAGSTKTKREQFNFRLEVNLKKRLEDHIKVAGGGFVTAYMEKLVQEHLDQLGK
ncbi:hypothetical protein FGK63_20435 [Ruegeria sediminis]|uniref:DUF3408 domain-containing protein n=1 Tax=Ruegeria sediminis TaxID=2583820 RepID=A0ABY2WS23_9RHOB|nr:hypothetical protein [Ruegeria sediminis]TMV02598.1 hypothetical protein FGK63_20435 [Ruegeria sediminis]